MSAVSDVLLTLLVAVASYLCGSFPTASIVGRLSGHDHSKEGSGNPGASNVYRTSGAGYGLITVVVDIAKGLVPVALALTVGREWAALAWACATFGHILPLGRFLSGGKGVATAGGGSLPLFPFVGIGLVAIFVIVVKITKRASVGSLTMAALLPIGVALVRQSNIELVAAVAVSLMIFVRHRANIGRLLSGDELKVR